LADYQSDVEGQSVSLLQMMEIMIAEINKFESSHGVVTMLEIIQNH